MVRAGITEQSVLEFMSSLLSAILAGLVFASSDFKGIEAFWEQGVLLPLSYGIEDCMGDAGFIEVVCGWRFNVILALLAYRHSVEVSWSARRCKLL